MGDDECTAVVPGVGIFGAGGGNVFSGLGFAVGAPEQSDEAGSFDLDLGAVRVLTIGRLGHNPRLLTHVSHLTGEWWRDHVDSALAAAGRTWHCRDYDFCTASLSPVGSVGTPSRRRYLFHCRYSS